MIHNEARFDDLIQAALAQDFSGWDFSYLHDRWESAPLPWDYAAIIRQHMQGVHSLLDMGTGGGEFLSSLRPLPGDTHATEAWPPNIPVAKNQLEPLGVTVHGIEDQAPLPFEDNQFDLVINRHEWYDPAEVYRILKPGSVFITQQVGERDNVYLNELIAGESPENGDWNLEGARDALIAAGFEIARGEEAFPRTEFLDIGAVVFYLKVIEWQIPGFSVEKYRHTLGDVHNMIEATGKLTMNQHRFLLVGRTRA